jgi:hypothetical protein
MPVDFDFKIQTTASVFHLLIYVICFLTSDL